MGSAHPFIRSDGEASPPFAGEAFGLTRPPISLSLSESPAMTATDPVVFLSYARTPMGGMQGVLSDASATDLGATAVKAAVERAGVKGDDIERIYMGCVLPAGLGPAPARTTALKAGSRKSVGMGRE